MQKPYLRLRAAKLRILKHRRIWPTLEICGSSGPTIPKVPCLHHINVYIKRKLRVWGTQKCNFLIGAETVPTVTGRQTTYSQSMPYMANIGNLRQFGASNPQGTVFSPNQCLYQKEATGVGNPKMQFPNRCRNRTYGYGPPNYVFSSTAVYGQHWKFAEVRGLQSPRYRVCTTSMFISKGSYGCGEPKNVIS